MGKHKKKNFSESKEIQGVDSLPDFFSIIEKNPLDNNTDLWRVEESFQSEYNSDLYITRFTYEDLDSIIKSDFENNEIVYILGETYISIYLLSTVGIIRLNHGPPPESLIGYCGKDYNSYPLINRSIDCSRIHGFNKYENANSVFREMYTDKAGNVIGGYVPGVDIISDVYGEYRLDRAIIDRRDYKSELFNLYDQRLRWNKDLVLNKLESRTQKEEESYSERTWKAFPDMYTSYFANLGILIPQRYGIAISETVRFWEVFSEYNMMVIFLYRDKMPGALAEIGNLPIIGGWIDSANDLTSPLYVWFPYLWAAFGRNADFKKPIESASEIARKLNNERYRRENRLKTVTIKLISAKLEIEYEKKYPGGTLKND